MKLRGFRPSDVSAIDRIWRQHHANDFSILPRDRAIQDGVVENENGEVVGYGQLQHFAEAMLVLDKSASHRQKVDALKLLMLEAFRGTDKAGLKQIYCFSHDPAYAALIERHFGFDIVDKGLLLLREEV